MTNTKKSTYVPLFRSLTAGFILTVMLLCSGCLFSSSENAQPAKEKQLPPITTEGKNTFGCRVDGKVWLPYTKPSWGWGFVPVQGDYDNTYQDFSLHANYKPKDSLWQSFFLNINNLDFSSDSIKLSAMNNNNNYAVFEYIYPKPEISYTTDSLHNGYIKFLRLDTVNRIASGTFWFNAVNTKGELILITDGRFDVTM